MSRHVFTTRHYQCVACRAKQDVLAWEYDPVPACACGGALEPAHARSDAHHVIDDQLEGGPRFFENMGNEPVYIESKSQWRREMEKRGLVNVVRHDSDYYQRQFRLHDEEKRDTGRNVEY